MSRARALMLGTLLCAACEASSPASVAPTSATIAEPLAAEPRAPQRQFGAAPRLEGAALPVEQLLATPEPHLGKLIKCEGKVARVCQNAGCWLELQAPAGGPGLRVPMAGHAFFIPQDAVGQLAVVEGELKRRPLDPATQAHYEGEGMQAVGPLSLEASSVLVR